jgi:Tol biopolymer transport system component
MKKYYSVFEQNIATKEIKTLETDKGGLYPPQLTNSEQIACADEKGLNNYNLESGKSELQKSVSKPIVIIDNQKIVLFVNGEKKILAPLGEGNYIWPSVSPDNQKLVFTFAGRGTYVSDLDGNVISNLGKADAPQWSPDSKRIMYMADIDDGHKVINSEIYVIDADGTNKVQITNTVDIHEMYPVWSPDGKKAAFNSYDGKIYLAELNID